MKCFKILLVFLFTTNVLFACGGCVDAPAAAAGSQTIKMTYTVADKVLAKAIDELIDSVSGVIAKEVANNKKYTESSQFNIDSLTFVKKLSFLHYQKVELLKSTKNNDKERE